MVMAISNPIKVFHTKIHPLSTKDLNHSIYDYLNDKVSNGNGASEEEKNGREPRI